MVEKRGTGEILLNCMDKDGKNFGYDPELTRMVKDAITITVSASSRAGRGAFLKGLRGNGRRCGTGRRHIPQKRSADRCNQGTPASERKLGEVILLTD